MQNDASDNSNIDVRHFRAAVAVAEERSFTAAALRLGVATSAVTEAVQQIEAQTGALLFDRRSRPIAVTPAGERFVAEGRQILALRQQALRDLGLVGGIERGHLAVAGAPSLVQTLLIPAIRVFSARHPGIRIAVHDDVAGRIEARILGKEVEFAVAARWAATPEIEAEEVGRDEIVLVCQRDDPLAALGEIGFEEVPADRVISLMAETGIARMLKGSLHFPRALLEGRLQAFSTISQLMMVKAGLGVAFLPRLAAGVLGEAELACLRVRGLALERPHYILWERRRTPSPAAEALKDCLRAVARDADCVRAVARDAAAP